MHINQFNDPDWDGTYQIVGNINGMNIILLKFKLSEARKVGRSNLVAIDDKDEILWIAQVPSMGFPSGVYYDVILNDGLLVGWYESTLVSIDPLTGKILSERFVR